MNTYFLSVLLICLLMTGCASTKQTLDDGNSVKHEQMELALLPGGLSYDACSRFWQSLNAIYVSDDGGTNSAFAVWAYPTEKEASAQRRVTIMMRETSPTSEIDLEFIVSDSKLTSAIQALADAQLKRVSVWFESTVSGLDEQGLRTCFEKFGQRKMQNRDNAMDSHAGWLAWGAFLYAANKSLPAETRNKREWRLLNQVVLTGALNDAYFGYKNDTHNPPVASCLIFTTMPLPKDASDILNYVNGRSSTQLLDDFRALAREFKANPSCIL